jgi:hypothetical protein
MKYIYLILFFSITFHSAFSHENALHKDRVAIQQSSDLIQTVLAYSTTEKTSKSSFTYDNNGNKISELVQQLRNDIWENETRSTVTYSDNNLKLSDVTEQWLDGQWENSFRSTYRYDANDKMTSYLSELWDSQQDSARWIPYSRYNYEYNSEGKEISMFNENWKSDKASWENFYRMTMSFSTNRDTSIQLDEMWKNGQWQNAYRYTNTFDSAANAFIATNEGYIAGKWQYTYRTHSTYDLNDNLLTKLTEKFATNWNNDTYETYTYNSTGKELSYLNQFWNSSKWEDSKHRISTQDSDQRIVKIVNEVYSNGKWVERDNSITLTDSKNRYFASYYPSYKLEIFYPGTTSASEEMPNKSLALNCSPNPTSGATSVDYSISEPGSISITVTNSLGIAITRLINNQMHEAGVYNINYDTSNLPNGVYFLIIKAGNRTETKKFVVIR